MIKTFAEAFDQTLAYRGRGLPKSVESYVRRKDPDCGPYCPPAQTPVGALLLGMKIRHQVYCATHAEPRLEPRLEQKAQPETGPCILAARRALHSPRP